MKTTSDVVGKINSLDSAGILEVKPDNAATIYKLEKRVKALERRLDEQQKRCKTCAPASCMERMEEYGNFINRLRDCIGG